MKVIQFTKTSLDNMAKEDVLVAVSVLKIPSSIDEDIEQFVSFVRHDEILDFYRNFNYTHYHYALYPTIIAKDDLSREYPQFKELVTWT